MNKTHIEHLVISMVLQGVIWLVTGSLWFGFVFVFGLFLGREHAQREYKIGDPSKLKGYEALNFWRWSTDAKIDLVLPTLVTFLVAIVFSYF